MSYSTIQDKMEKIQELPFKQAEKLIYEWTKTNCISLKEFRMLVEANRNSIW